MQGLSVQDGHACLAIDCPFLTTSLAKIQMHLRKEQKGTKGEQCTLQFVQPQKYRKVFFFFFFAFNFCLRNLQDLGY